MYKLFWSKASFKNNIYDSENKTHFASWKARNIKCFFNTLAIFFVLRKHFYYTAKRFKYKDNNFSLINNTRITLQHCTHFFTGIFSDLSTVSVNLVCALSKNIVVLVFN